KVVKHCIAAFGLRALRVQVQYSTNACAALRRGRAVVHANHVSLLDGIIVALASPVPLVFAVDTDYSRRSWAARIGLGFLSRMGFGSVVPIDATAPFGIRSLRRAIASGANVMVFPEGSISPSGQRQSDQPGLEWLVARTGATPVAVEIHGAEHSRLFAKAGTRLWPRITLDF
ncbi:1-acyl-sn-glycerol-3-phosphate acyltransferase, partial [Paraburkholderia sp. A1RI-2L]|uniref:1-acyl-sn-glycerol-3-phosphate acyltransferase n=1 Tax=Paraburkholderia sp. A1RI-2L TaxID=3028367 RepID=UPI003B771706